MEFFTVQSEDTHVENLTSAPQQRHGHLCVRRHQRRCGGFGRQVVARGPDSVNQWGGCPCCVAGSRTKASPGSDCFTVSAKVQCVMKAGFGINSDVSL